MSNAQQSPTRLTLEALEFGQSDSSLFYSELNNFIIPSLEMFCWSGNVVPEQYFETFKQFILNQPNLVELGFSNCLLFNEPVFAALAEFASVKPLRSLEIRGMKLHVFGRHLIPMLEVLLSRATIKMLDITGQAVGDRGLELIARLSELCLDDLRFDGSNPSSHEVLIEVTARIAASRIGMSAWPTDDAKAVTSIVPFANRRQVAILIENARKEFNTRFGKRGESVEISEELTGGVQTNSGILHERRRLSLGHPIDKKILEFTEPAVKEVLVEIFDENELQDPFIRLSEQLEQESDLDTLMARYGEEIVS
jgi:hypothetical protein